MVPLTVNGRMRCEKDLCSNRDLLTCCTYRRTCYPSYGRDVPGGCPQNEVVNPFSGAFCRTYPCTIGDIDVCCIPKHDTLFERTELFRSKYPRELPDELA